MSTLAVARAFFEAALEDARARQDRAEEKVIGLRLCEVMEMQDFNEVRVLAEVAAAEEEERDHARSERHRVVRGRRR